MIRGRSAKKKALVGIPRLYLETLGKVSKRIQGVTKGPLSDKGLIPLRGSKEEYRETPSGEGKGSLEELGKRRSSSEKNFEFYVKGPPWGQEND